MSSVMIVPLCIGSEAIGVISLVAAESGRHYTRADLAVAEEVASRSALAISNARLYTEAQKAVSLRDEFISVASHELKTPVTSLKMYTQVLQRDFNGRGEDRVNNLLGKMDAQINKLNVLITDLLNVSKLQLGKLEFHETNFSLRELLDEVIEVVGQTSDRHTIQFECNEPCEVWGDRDRIGQVLANLLTNAIKYSPQADTVQVTLRNSKGHVVVSVRDYGIGIEKEHLPRIFNRFYRVAGHQEKTFPGLGLGLYISHEIITRHGGKMSVVSKRGKGSTFSFTLPVTATTSS